MKFINIALLSVALTAGIYTNTMPASAESEVDSTTELVTESQVETVLSDDGLEMVDKSVEPVDENVSTDTSEKDQKSTDEDSNIMLNYETSTEEPKILALEAKNDQTETTDKDQESTDELDNILLNSETSTEEPLRMLAAGSPETQRTATADSAEKPVPAISAKTMPLLASATERSSGHSNDGLFRKPTCKLGFFKCLTAKK